MSVNSSSSALLHLQPKDCNYPEINFIVLSLVVVFVLTTPLFVSVFVVGYQKWRKQRAGSSFTSSSHIDVFTYNMIVLDFVCVLGTCLYSWGKMTNQAGLRTAGNCMFGIFTPGQILFHLVTCVERYLAVVHPIIYLHLRGSGGVRIRNVTIGCVWMTSFGLVAVTTWLNVQYTVVTCLFLSFTSVAFAFCSLSILCALIRPGPSEGGRERDGVDQSKQRAFHTMLIITGVLLFRFLGSLIVTIIQMFSQPYSYLSCLIGWSSVWFLVPSSLVLPLLFLQREGRLPGCGPKPDESA